VQCCQSRHHTHDTQHLHHIMQLQVVALTIHLCVFGGGGARGFWWWSWSWWLGDMVGLTSTQEHWHHAASDGHTHHTPAGKGAKGFWWWPEGGGAGMCFEVEGEGVVQAKTPSTSTTSCSFR
jgi:hypothetical protein